MWQWRNGGVVVILLLLSLILSLLYVEEAQARRRWGRACRQRGAARVVNAGRGGFNNRGRFLARDQFFDNGLGNQVFADDFVGFGFNNRFGLNPLVLGFDANGDTLFSQNIAVDRFGRQFRVRPGSIVGSSVIDPSGVVAPIGNNSIFLDGFANNGFENSGSGFDQISQFGNGFGDGRRFLDDGSFGGVRRFCGRRGCR